MTKLKFWHNTETQIVTKLKNSNCDQTKKTQIVTWRKNSNCDKTQKLKLLPNSKTQNVTRRKNPNCGKTHKPKLLQNSKTQIVIKLKLCQYQNCKKTQKLKVWQNLICLNFLSQFSVTCFFVTQFLWFFFSKKKLTQWQSKDVFRPAFRDTRDVSQTLADQRIDRQTTRLLELLRAAKKQPEELFINAKPTWVRNFRFWAHFLKICHPF